mmetsp:Transcript_65852/g.122883  ORF Transcript_65852/g.122883 Transcript_65852/m.122883 type:complete len:503 (-) Transcript_65852:95-1603(-)
MPGTKEHQADPDWFEHTFGFQEGKYFEAKDNFEFRDGVLQSKASGQKFRVGYFETPTLEKLKHRLSVAMSLAREEFKNAGELTFQNVVGDTFELHADPGNAGAVFQVASLTNCLETLVEKGRVPEDGITGYCEDATQGASCAISCPAATVFRNYFMGGGQAETQVDLLSTAYGFLKERGTDGYWVVRNGYPLPRLPGRMGDLSRHMLSDQSLTEAICDKLQVGIHPDTEVAGGTHKVCQVFCYALPVSQIKKRGGQANECYGFAKHLLIAMYDATLTIAATMAAQRSKRVAVYLTALGLGEFGNRREWITAALDEALQLHAKEPLDVMIVHFSQLPKPNDPFSMLEVGRKQADLPSRDLQSPVTKRRPTFAMTGKEGLPRKAKPQPVNNKKAPEEKVVQPEKSSELAAGQGKDDDDEDGKGVSSELRELFKLFDRNGDGMIDRQEFADVLKLADEDYFTPAVVGMLLDEADADGNGIIHYHEFLAWVFKEDVEITSRLGIEF